MGVRGMSVLAVGLGAAVFFVGPAAAAGGGTGYAGTTSQGWPVAVTVSSSGKQVVRIGAGLDLKCTSGGFLAEPDYYGRLTIKKTGSFQSHFENQLIDLGGGRTALLSGDLKGKFNRARTKVSGTWHLSETDRDNLGNPTNQCDSGTVKFSATQ